jgi:cysteine desulfurase / selenocysteine lyase
MKKTATGGVAVIYFDNSATSWPKPPGVAAAMTRYLDEIGGNPGRAGHRLAIEAARLVYAAREAIAELFNAADPLRVIFGANATEALNLGLNGLLQPGDHVITSGMEHNSVMRPLRLLERSGVRLTVVRCSLEGALDPADLETAIESDTRMIVLNHASNVCGTLLPVAEAGRIAREHDALLMVDAAQTAGACPIDMQSDAIDLLAFTGHKSLYGPMGTGGLVIGDRVNAAQLTPQKRGGTGSRSEYEEQPEFLPDKFESGTPNAVGLAGLIAGIRWVQEQGVANIRARELDLTGQLLAGLASMPEVTIHGPRNAHSQTATVSFNIAGMESSEIGLRLDEEYEIMCRVGLHCSPAAHKSLGTFPAGTVRFGLGAFNTSAEVAAALQAVAALCRKAG